jgi:hypothetical protein
MFAFSAFFMALAGFFMTHVREGTRPEDAPAT